MNLESGFAFKSSEWVEAGTPVIKIRNVQDGYVDLTGCSYVSQQTAAKASEWLGQVGNTLIALTGAGVGEIGRIYENQTGLINQRVGWVRAKDYEDEDYIYYLLRFLKHKIIDLATGSAQPNVSPRDILQISCRVPEKSHRIVVGNFLSNLDKKIEKNIALSKTLEDAAQTIFKSWFIDFDPVKAKMAGGKPVGMDDATAALFPDSMEDSELGLIPRGWTARNLGDVCNIKQGRYLGPSQMVEMSEGADFVPVIGGNGVLGYTSKSTFNFDVPLVTCRGSRCGLLQWGIFPSWVSNNAMAVTMQNSSKYSFFVYLFLKSTNLDNAITGSAQPQITITNLGYTRIVLPPKQIIDAFSDLTEQMRAAVNSLNSESKSLAKIRDALLPRLISGELQIPEEMLVS